MAIDFPPFIVGSDAIMSGTEPEFTPCNEIVDRYLRDAGATAQARMYASNSSWGYVLRVYYTAGGGEGTIICWTGKSADESGFAVDVPGRIEDLVVGPAA